MLITANDASVDHSHHVKDVLLSTSALAASETVKWKGKEVTVVRLGSGEEGTRDALYVITGAPSELVDASRSQLHTTKLIKKEAVQETPAAGTATARTTAALALQPGQCVVARRELLSAEDDTLAESLRILERRWTFFMCAATIGRVQKLELVFSGRGSRELSLSLSLVRIFFLSLSLSLVSILF